MTDETEANPAPVADDVRATDMEAETVETNEVQNDADTEADLGEPAVETIKIERNGKIFEIPKALEGELLMQQDYTKKTMTLADERKAAEADIQAQRQAFARQTADVETYVTYKTLTEQKAQYDALDPQALRQLQHENPAEFDRLDREYDRIERAIAKTEQTMAQRQAETATQAQQRATAEREQTLAESARAIPNFTDERRTALEKLAVEKGGYSADQIKMATAGDYVMLDLAAEGLKARQNRQAAAKLTAAADVEPAAEITGTSTRQVRDPAKMTDAEWYQHRKKSQK